MNKKRALVTWAIIVLSILVNCGCAVIGTALSAGAAYGIYMATKK